MEGMGWGVEGEKVINKLRSHICVNRILMCATCLESRFCSVDFAAEDLRQQRKGRDRKGGSKVTHNLSAQLFSVQSC